MGMCMLGCEIESEVDFPADSLQVSWEVLRNGLNGDSRFLAAFTITNQSTQTLDNKGWRLYYNQIPRAVDTTTITGGVKIETMNGGFYRIVPTEEFKPLAPGTSRRIEYESEFWAIKETDGPTGLYMVFLTRLGREKEPQPITQFTIKPFETAEQIHRTETDVLPLQTPELWYEQNRARFAVNDTMLPILVPTPEQIYRGGGYISLTSDTEIHYQKGLFKEARFLASVLARLLGKELRMQELEEPDPQAIQLVMGNVPLTDVEREAYHLRLSPARGLIITGSDPSGVFYGIQSLLSLISTDDLKKGKEVLRLPSMTIVDKPRFSYRGFMLDVSRNFQEKNAVLKVLDLMATYKLNRFHFHLTDDEGWRLEIPGLPELTQVGGQRGHTLDEQEHLFPAYGSGHDTVSHGSGFYSRRDFIEILRYAHDRHIEVIPELDFPGHARAAIKSMEARAQNMSRDPDGTTYLLHDPDDKSIYSSAQAYSDNVVCVCRESTYRFLDKVVAELVAMYDEAKVPFSMLHTGGDEVPEGVWANSPICRELIKTSPEVNSVEDMKYYFLRRFYHILAQHGITTAGWEETTMRNRKKGDEFIHEPNPEFVEKDFRPYVWNSIFGWGGEDVAYQLANAGYSIVMCNASNLYFDAAYNNDPQEPGLYWPGFVDTRKAYEFAPYDLYKSAYTGIMGETLDPVALAAAHTALNEDAKGRILGLQGELWSEVIKGQEMMEYAVFPKMLGLAERAWAKQPYWAVVKDPELRKRELDWAWNLFANTLGRKELPRLDYLFGGVNYRIPPPGAILEDGRLRANVSYPGMEIRYTTNGVEPTAESTLYTGPVSVSGTVKVRTFATNGRGSRVVVLGEEE